MCTIILDDKWGYIELPRAKTGLLLWTSGVLEHRKLQLCKIFGLYLTPGVTLEKFKKLLIMVKLRNDVRSCNKQSPMNKSGKLRKRRFTLASVHEVVY